MSIIQSNFNSITEKYAKTSSWAVWNNTNLSDVSFIEANKDILNSRLVGIGLNISGELSYNWQNFHGGKHDRKLAYALNESHFKGAYLTDLFKNINQKDSKILIDNIGANLSIINKHIDTFCEEMMDIGVNDKTIFLIFGVEKSYLGQIISNLIKSKFQNNQFVYHYHYSYYKLTDKDWVEGLWKKIGISNNFEEIRNKYQ